MLSKIKKLFKGTKETAPPEWRTENSIYNFIANNIDPDGKLKPTATELPDEEPREGTGIRFGPGVLDSLFGVDDSEDALARATALADLLEHIAKHGDAESAAELYQTVTTSDSVIGIIDAVLEQVVGRALPIQPYLLDVCRDLSFSTGHRNSVKLGIAMVGLCADLSSLERLKTIALHDEFTLFATVAILNCSDDAVTDLWDIAKKTNGWGKIHLVERLASMEFPDKMKPWFITEGYRNGIMYEYLAYTCAEAGELHKVLEADRIDDKRFFAGVDIVCAMMNGEPGTPITEYVYAAVVVEDLVRHASAYDQDIRTFVALGQIKTYLTDLQEDAEQRDQNGWTEDRIGNCLIEIYGISSAGHWPQLAMSALQSGDHHDHWNGKRAAEILGLDVWDTLWQKLQKDPSNNWLYYDVLQAAKPDMIAQIVELAMRTIPFGTLKTATGPEATGGYGPNYKWYDIIDSVVSHLKTYPGLGGPIVMAALDSTVIRNRNVAINTLHQWGSENWPEDIATKLISLKNTDADEDIKVRVGRLLNGESPDPPEEEY